jgi:choline dehydrogenase-like flavoprotein
VPDDFDVIVIGTGAGGGTLAHTLAPSGKRILLLERGDFLTRELDNWEAEPVFVDGKYISTDTWYDGDGTPFQPQVQTRSTTCTWRTPASSRASARSTRG